MGVYIKGMEMPRNCEECNVKVVCKNYWKLIREQHTRPSWCPLVPVPSHGRLGDLDEIERYKERLVVDADKIKPGIRYVVDTKYIKEAPTIIPAEEGET